MLPGGQCYACIAQLLSEPAACVRACEQVQCQHREHRRALDQLQRASLPLAVGDPGTALPSSRALSALVAAGTGAGERQRGSSDGSGGSRSSTSSGEVALRALLVQRGPPKWHGDDALGGAHRAVMDPGAADRRVRRLVREAKQQHSRCVCVVPRSMT